MINRSIIIRFPVKSQTPFVLGMSDEILDKSGLTKLGVDIYGDDTVHDWTRKEKDLLHVMVEGGPSAALAFIEERMIYRAVIIPLTVTF